MINDNRATSSEMIPVKITPNLDYFVICFSSGSTGRPKPVPKTHKNVMHVKELGDALCEFTTESSVVSVHTPLFHGCGLNTLMGSLFSKAIPVISPKFTPEKFALSVEKYKVSQSISC